jgi:transglutaminase/protease-like cytokinesis protein 3
MQARWNMTTMKKMYKNKVQGVCATFATAEGCLFDALGIKSEVGTGYNHAWRIVRVKNSDKKVMYVTFDYTLGFRTVRGNEAYEKLSAAKKYQTIIRAYFIKHPKEKMPKKQNFVYSTDIY